MCKKICPRKLLLLLRSILFLDNRLSKCRTLNQIKSKFSFWRFFITHQIHFWAFFFHFSCLRVTVERMLIFHIRIDWCSCSMFLFFKYSELSWRSYAFLCIFKSWFLRNNTWISRMSAPNEVSKWYETGRLSAELQETKIKHKIIIGKKYSWIYWGLK